MNKTCNRYKNSFLFILVMCLILFNGVFVLSGCGLDTFYYIEAPVVPSDHTIPTIQQNDILYQTFKVRTNVEKQSSGGFSYIGSEIYYKIYNDEATLERDKSHFLGKIQRKDYDTANQLIETYKYQVLHIGYSNNSHQEFLIKDRTTVQIRLTDKKISGYENFIKIGNVDEPIGVPLRINGKSFDFKKDYKPYKGENNSDVSIEKDKTDGIWYVTLYAVSRGHEQNYIPRYSDITYLGSVKIDENLDN